MNIQIKPNDIEKVAKKYQEFKTILQVIEDGKWSLVQTLPVEKLENMRFIVEELDRSGFSRLVERKQSN